MRAGEAARTVVGGTSRRAVLGVGLGALGLGAATLLGGCSIFEFRGPRDTVGTVDFSRPLAIPPLAQAERIGDTRVVHLKMQAGTTAFVPGGTANTWGLNGFYLGPTVRVRRGDTLRIEVSNALPERTSLHWHGMRLPASADGGPHQMIEPGGTWSPEWRVDQQAATLWYHPHPHGLTERHVYKGLGGLLIVDDEDEAALPLPREYGVDDLPVIVQDKTFGEDGSLKETSRKDNGMIGETLVVNGTVGPYLEASSRRVRLRLLNASTARSYAFGLDAGSLTMIASDGGLLAAPHVTERVLLTPGERAEVLVDLEPGVTRTLRSFPHELGMTPSRSKSVGAADTLDVLQIRPAATLSAVPELPPTLAKLAPAVEPAGAVRRSFELRNNRINGEAMRMDRIDTAVTVDTDEVWEVWNGHDQPHNFHVHDVQFRVLSVGAAAPSAELSGWKDTVYLPPKVRLRLALRFTGHTDPGTPYMYHCHLLWHEDAGMMGQFVVLKPGEQPIPLAGGHS